MGIIAMNYLTIIVCFTSLIQTASAFERRVWQAPQIEENGKEITISIGDQPAGLFFTDKLDSEKRYRLTVDGRGGPFTMRMTRDGGTPQYLAAPAAQTSLTITGTRDLELLFYADKAARYTLAHLAIEPCPDCKTAEDVKARVRADIPGIDAMQPLEKGQKLLYWAANVSDFTADAALTPKDFESWPAEKALFDFFDKDIGGVSCGGMSVFTKNIFHLFDLDAVTVNYGVPDTNVTHVSVVLHDRGHFYLFDPTFAATYEREGLQVSLRDAFTALQAEKKMSFRAKELSLARRDLLEPGPTLEAHVCAEKDTTKGGLIHCRMGSRNYRAIVQDTQGELWKSFGVELDEFALLKLFYKGMFSVGEGLKPETRLQLIAMLKEQGIPFH